MRTEKTPALVTIGEAANLLSREFPDVSVSSLRFLEREGLLSPERKPGGHRLYSSRDLERARRIKRWQAERIPLKDIRLRLERASKFHLPGDIVANMTSSLLAENDIHAVMDMLYDVYETGTPVLTLCNDILTPLLRNLGDDKGNHLIPVDVQLELDEHLITFFSRIMLAPENASGSPVIVAACPPWERHDMPLRMMGALLSERGAAVHFFGAQVDSQFVQDAIRRVEPDSILISLTVRPPQIASAWFAEIIAMLDGDQRMLIGGMGSAFMPPFEEANVEIAGMLSYAEITDRLMNQGDSYAGQS